DGRNRPPHMRSWRDGWRNLRFLLLFSPRWLFLYPGFLLMIIGLGAGVWLWSGPKMIGRVTFDAHTLFYAAVAIIIGFQAFIFAISTKIFAISEGLLPEDPRLTKVFGYVTLEVGLITGVFVLLLGLVGSIYALYLWRGAFFGPLIYTDMLRIVIPAGAALSLGCQIILSSFFLSVLRLKRR